MEIEAMSLKRLSLEAFKNGTRQTGPAAEKNFILLKEALMRG